MARTVFWSIPRLNIRRALSNQLPYPSHRLVGKHPLASGDAGLVFEVKWLIYIARCCQELPNKIVLALSGVASWCLPLQR